MTYSRRNTVEDQQEASQKAQQITAICEQLNITLDPINWQEYGMHATVQVNSIDIAPLMDLSHYESDDLLRRVQLKLFEHAALNAIQARPGLKAVMWSPVDIVQPQKFLCLWVITLDTDERIPIIESIKDDQRVYEPFMLTSDGRQFAELFGPAIEGVYHPGEQVTIKERERQFTGEIVYVIPPGKVNPNRKHTSRGYHTIAGTAYTNDVTARYIVDCHDGFPHIVHQSQIVS